MNHTRSKPQPLRRVRRLALLAAAMALQAAPGAAAEPPAWQLSLRYDHHSDGLPLDQMGSRDWAKGLRPRQGLNLSYVEDELRLERQQGPWSLALLARSSASLVASPDAMELASLISRGEHPAGDRQWDNEVLLRGFNGVGLEVGHTHRLAGGWSARWTAQGLLLTRWRERQLDGPASYAAGSGSYQFDLQSQELDDKRRFPFQQDFAAQGAGLLLGAELDWQGEQAFAALALQDGGWLHWRNVPQQQLRLDSSTQAVDADGFLIYRPLIQGQNSQQGRTRRQPWRAQLKAGWKLEPQAEVSASVEHRPDFGLLPALQWRQREGEREWGLEWRFHERRATLSLGWQHWRLRVGSDSLDSQARSRELGLTYLRTF